MRSVHALHSFGLAPEEVEKLWASRTWSDRVAGAHTVAREVRAEEAYRVDPERFRELTVPVLPLLGEQSPDWAPEGTERIRAVLPDARVALLPARGTWRP
jgi:pimeloyl-ACP methyl ester carboxylesterase